MTVKEKIEKLKEYINGIYGEEFRQAYYGKFFTGSMTFTEDQESGTIYLEQGVVTHTEEGIPEKGIDIGLAGTKKGWDMWSECRRSLSVVCYQIRQSGSLEDFRTIGESIRYRQNNNALAQAGRLYSYIRDGVMPGSDLPKRDEPRLIPVDGDVPIRGFYKRINGVKIYFETNDGPKDRAVLICLHTAGRENRQYHDLMELFMDKYLLYSIDMPGHGKSWPLPGNQVISDYVEYGKWIWDCIQALGVKNPIIIGCSMAGGITYHIAQEHSVRGIVCMQGNDNTEDGMGNVRELLFHPYVCPQHSHYEFTESLIGTKTSQDRVDFINWGVLCENGKIKQGDLTETGTFNVSDKMDRITCPVLIIEGIDDQAYTPEMAQGSMDRLVNCKNKRMKLYEGYGHFIAVENPEAVSEAIEEFIESMDEEEL